MNEEVVPRRALLGRLVIFGEVEVAESPPVPPPPGLFVDPFANVLSPPSIENEEVSGLRFVDGLRFKFEDPPVPFVPPFELPPLPAIGIGSEPPPSPPPFEPVPDTSPGLAAVVLLPIDIPNPPFPLVSPSLYGNLTETTASLEG